VQHSDRIVPRPVVSVLLEEKRVCAMLSANGTHPKVRLLASISRNIRQDATVANLLDRGDIESFTSGNRRKGSSVACLAGPRPRAAAQEIRLKWRASESGM
jgi:hypothetical protein